MRPGSSQLLQMAWCHWVITDNNTDYKKRITCSRQVGNSATRFVSNNERVCHPISIWRYDFNENWTAIFCISKNAGTMSDTVSVTKLWYLKIFEMHKFRNWSVTRLFICECLFQVSSPNSCSTIRARCLLPQRMLKPCRKCQPCLTSVLLWRRHVCKAPLGELLWGRS